MAFKQTNIFPIDQQPRNAVGLAYPFSTAFDQEKFQTLNSPSSSLSGNVPFKLNYTTSDQIKSNLITFFSTKKGERFLNPNYGTNIFNYLFDQVTDDTARAMEQTIKDELAMVFPQVNLNSLEVLQSIDFNQIKVILNYSIFNNEEDTLEINLNV
jgi:phage baseplate assembly protein W